MIPTTIDESWFQGRLQVMERPECLTLLASTRVGRVARNDEHGPVIVPVNHRMDGARVVFRTSPHTVLGRDLAGTPLSFQVDDFDAFQQCGWSVLLRGTAAYVDVDDLPAHVSDRPVPWAAGERPTYVRITPYAITGRRLLAT